MQSNSLRLLTGWARGRKTMPDLSLNRRVERHELRQDPRHAEWVELLSEIIVKGELLGSLMPDCRATDFLTIAVGYLRDTRQELIVERKGFRLILAENARMREALTRIAEGCGPGNGMVRSLAERALDGSEL